VRQRGRTRRRLLVVALVLLLPAGVAGAALLWTKRQVAPHLHDRIEEVTTREVAIVLGASVYRSGRPSPVVEERLVAALALLRAKKVRRILVSGDHRPQEYDEAEAMRRWLLRAGVRPEQVLIDRAGRRTFDSMLRASELFRLRRVVVCTQSFHLPRAVFLARGVGLDAVGLVADAGQRGVRWRDLPRESVATLRALWDVRSLSRRLQ
jgi:SanA protein